MSISPSGQTAEGKGVEPSSHVPGNRFSKAVRQAVSAYLPFFLSSGPTGNRTRPVSGELGQPAGLASSP